MKSKHLFHLFWVLLALPLLWAGCDRKEKITTKFEPTGELPPITSEGVGSFGCLVNGEVWLPLGGPYFGLGSQFRYSYHEPTGSLDIGCSRRIKNENGLDSVRQLMTINGKVFQDSINLGLFQDSLNCNSLTTAWTGEPFLLIGSLPWHLDIHHLDTEKNIIAGTFSFSVAKEDCPDTIHITEGRFDIHY
ncbi:MAG TPA: hypothetical protein PKA00_22630 [Saprospiraceae bacterium]|nr:hypothetical protein [Saprospiraceae bacterium]HMQ85725.1 hypothetical protein [Saprospiraceae bacterium]